MDEKVRKQIGNKETLQFDLELFSNAKHPPSMLWGRMLASLGDESVWYTESGHDPEAPVDWSWIDLLEFLGDKWPWLMLEELYPIPMNPLHPGTMRREAEKRWESTSEEQYLDEDERLFRFEARHDLAMGLKGIFLPSLFILRQGEKAWVCSQETRLFASFREIATILVQLGDCLSAYAENIQNTRCERAVQRWRSRDERVRSLLWELRTGMSRELRARLEQGQSPDEFWEVGEAKIDSDNELMAAARLSAGIVDIEQQRRILEQIKISSAKKISELDEISLKISSELDESMRPYEQGYTVAQLLRRELDMNDNSRAEPQAVLADWGVDIQEIALDYSPLEAVAVWGPNHGPVVMLNSSGGRPAHIHGRRSTLAHEICHLLIDRNGALPFSEVFGGHTPLYVEQRANAFAAEFLLPRESAVDQVRHRRSTSLHEALETLSEHFAVSMEMAALQIKNSRLFFDLSEEERGLILRCTETHSANNI